MRRILTFTATLLVTASVLAAGDIYRWKDDAGTWHYSDQPHPGAELVRRASNYSDDSSVVAPTAPTPGTLTSEDASSLPVSRDVASQVREEAAAAKADQCKKAEDAYQKAVQARRIYKIDDKGNRVYLTDAQIDAARLQARAVRDQACGPGN